jgi:hypothetical protein
MARTGSDEIRVGSNLVEQVSNLGALNQSPVKPLRNDVANPTSIRAVKRRLARDSRALLVPAQVWRPYFLLTTACYQDTAPSKRHPP